MVSKVSACAMPGSCLRAPLDWARAPVNLPVAAIAAIAPAPFKMVLRFCTAHTSLCLKATEAESKLAQQPLSRAGGPEQAEQMSAVCRKPANPVILSGALRGGRSRNACPERGPRNPQAVGSHHAAAENSHQTVLAAMLQPIAIC